MSHPAITCSKLTTESLGQGVNYVQICSIVNFEKVNAGQVCFCVNSGSWWHFFLFLEGRLVAQIFLDTFAIFSANFLIKVLFCSATTQAAHIIKFVLLYVVRCAIWYRLYNLKNVKNAHGGVLILVKLQTEAYNFTKINSPPWVLFTFFKLYKSYQIAQRTTYIKFCCTRGESK